MNRLFVISIVFIPLLLLAGCGGAKVLEEPEPRVVTQSLPTASDQHLVATLDWVIIRDGPRAWAKKADWDEYLLRVQNLSDESIQITNITVLDSLATQIEPGEDRKQLVKGTKEAKRRYKNKGMKVKAGAIDLLPSGSAVAGATVVAGVAVGAAAASTLGTAAGAAVGAGAAVIVLLPALAVGSMIHNSNNKEENQRIEYRQTTLPIVLQEKEEEIHHIFFPLTPSPRQIEFTYVDSRGSHTLIIDTRTALDGLHLVGPEK